MPIPKWGIDTVQSLDVARIRARVCAEEEKLRIEKVRRDTLIADISKSESLAEIDETQASKLRSDAKALTKATAEGRVVEEQRKEAIKKAVEETASERQEVEALRQSIKDLSVTRAKNAEDLKQLLDKKDGRLSELKKSIESMEKSIESIRSRTKEAESRQKEKQAEFAKELANARREKDIIEQAFKRAQERAEAFAVQPDDELAAEIKQLDSDEEAIIRDADSEVREIISSKFAFVSTIDTSVKSHTVLTHPSSRRTVLGEHSIQS